MGETFEVLVSEVKSFLFFSELVGRVATEYSAQLIDSTNNKFRVISRGPYFEPRPKPAALDVSGTSFIAAGCVDSSRPSCEILRAFGRPVQVRAENLARTIARSRLW